MRKTILYIYQYHFLPSGLPLIAASIGPYGAHLHDGSDYSGDYAEKVKPEVIKEWHKTHIDAVLEAGVDALAFETVPCQVNCFLNSLEIFDSINNFSGGSKSIG